jgi:hypothetical protein
MNIFSLNGIKIIDKNYLNLGLMLFIQLLLSHYQILSIDNQNTNHLKFLFFLKEFILLYLITHP